MKNKKNIILIYLLLLTAPLHTYAETNNLQKVGEGSAYWGPFKLYEAQFYTEPNSDLASALADDTAASLRLCYSRDLTVKNFVDGANEALPKELPKELQQAVEQLHTAYLPVKSDDCYNLTYTPQEGTQLWLNDQLLTQIRLPHFKALYFGIWIGDNPLSAKLKADLTQDLVSNKK